MKRNTAAFLLVLLLVCALPAVSLANSWGLSGRLLAAVSTTSLWNDYTTLCEQAGDAAVMYSRYHNVLMVLENGELGLYTTAVYQPGHKLAKKVSLKAVDDELTLSYGKGESYTFRRTKEGYKLYKAAVGDMTVVADTRDSYWGCTAICKGESVRIQREYLLADFNIDLFPRTLEECRHLNLMNEALDSSEAILGWWGEYGERGTLLHSPGEGTVPVYSSPNGESAWRAAKGKAAVGLAGDLWVHHSLTTPDGETYACIRYDVSQRTQRIGYIKAEALGYAEEGRQVADMMNLTLRTTCATYLTDDPNVSQFRQLEIPKDQQLTCIGLYGRDYAYVSAEVRDGKIVSGGQIVWGFVPLRDLEIDPDERHLREDVMAQAAGCWNFEAGGSLAHDSIVLGADGSYLGNSGMYTFTETADSVHGTWYVTDYNPARNLYWNGPEYEITILFEDGSASVHGLSLDGDTLSLTYWEGGGGYQRCQPGQTAPADEDNG
ncbi:MAG: hypothetical protein E7320_05740 [Clostridiales bacterium]|nr:hypothetical protein [Clostridiales bacterium]